MENYNSIDYLFLKMLLEGLKNKIENKINCGKLHIFYLDPEKISEELYSLRDYHHPVMVPILIGEYLIPNPDGLPLISFYVGRNSAKIELMRGLNEEETKLYEKILQLCIEDQEDGSCPAAVLNSFSRKIILLACHFSKKDRESKINMNEILLAGLEKKTDKNATAISSAKVELSQLKKSLVDFSIKYEKYLNIF